ncbi:putative ATP-grasp superfamily ATP-dependent carboligase [Lipingzhangella halophila]|uniref:Putative ATP-grasp superfamily ATP-dependent carboligase n=1 Tax=Lipingzhangella halophila TaxID=1783352 RepID=A0A7W7RJG2_9ACTN|nr:PAC2 family protein [Lipingzhangella halophila]MBB4932576.1 putative ATP-grasp superfamily ATP-dependent carboligase [Lipingzhangella halophila]
MRDPADLYELRPGYELAKPVMLVVLDGFVDAGSVGKQAAEALFDAFDAEEVATFDVDRLVDYRARRPVMTFVENTWTEYEAPKLVLYLMHDTEGTPFLLLHGPEPDREWEAFADAVRDLVRRLSVSLTVSLHGIPMAVPHTRPSTVTPHATRPDLVAGHVPWIGRIQVPASAVSLLEFRMGDSGHDFIGYAVHVPSYLAQSEYPRAAIAALEYVNGATGLALPTGKLEENAESADAEIEEQVADSEEVQRVVANLERQYDDIMSARQSNDGTEPLLAGNESGLPTADELGAELERYLAEREGGGDA